jgi:hypothetical protein
VALLRDAGIDISRATMCGWVMAIGEMLMPVAKAMQRQLLAGSYIQADETPVDVQTHDGSGTNHQAYMWQYGTPYGMRVFDFRMSRKREGPLKPSSATSMAFSKPTPMLHTIELAERRWCTPDAGLMREDTSSMRSN